MIDIATLSQEERLRLLEQLWDSLSAAPETIPLTDGQLEELDRRLDELAGTLSRIERSAARASKALDRTLRAMTASQRRIVALEAAAPRRPATRGFTLERLRREQRDLERRLGRSLVVENWLEALARGREPL
jgi:putative addiction module component (TIGR02574 family)